MCCCTKSAQWKIALGVGIILALIGIAIILLSDQWILEVIGGILITVGLSGAENSYYQSVTGIKWCFWTTHIVINVFIIDGITISYALILGINFYTDLKDWEKIGFDVFNSAIIGFLSNFLT